MTPPGRIESIGTSPDPVLNPPVGLKTTVTASHGPAILTKDRAKSQADMTGILAKALTRSLLGRKKRA